MCIQELLNVLVEQKDSCVHPGLALLLQMRIQVQGVLDLCKGPVRGSGRQRWVADDGSRAKTA